MSLEGRGSARRQVILEVSPRAGGRAGRRRRGEGEPTCTDARVFVGPPCSSTIFHANDGVTPISGEAKDRMGGRMPWIGCMMGLRSSRVRTTLTSSAALQQSVWRFAGGEELVERYAIGFVKPRRATRVATWAARRLLANRLRACCCEIRCMSYVGAPYNSCFSS